MSEPREVDVEEFAAGWAAGKPVVDVREPWEYTQGHVPGALLMPLKQLQEHFADLPDGDTVYVICASGNRSLRGPDPEICWPKSFFGRRRDVAMDSSRATHPNLNTTARALTGG